MSYHGEVFENFWNTEHGKSLIKTAQQEMGPTQDEIDVAHPGGGETTQVSNPGTGGEGEYDVAKKDVEGDGAPADGHVETVKEVAPTMEEVARKGPPAVSQAEDVRSFTRSGAKDEVKGPGGHKPDATGPHGRGQGPGKGKGDGTGLKKVKEEEKDEKKDDKKDKKAFVEELVRIANELDELGLTEESTGLDEIACELAGLKKEAFFHPDQYQGDKAEKKEEKEPEKK